MGWEVETEYAATYPRNHVFETEGGHIKEYDDTFDKERIHERHSSGSGYEIFSMVLKSQELNRITII